MSTISSTMRDNYYISSGIKIITTAQDIQKQLNAISEKYALMTDIRIRLTAKPLAANFQLAVERIISNLNLTGAGLPQKQTIEGFKPSEWATQGQLGTRENISVTKVYTKEGWTRLRSTMKLQEDLNTTLKFTFNGRGEIAGINRNINTYATQIALKTENLTKKLLSLKEMNKINASDFRTIANALEDTNKLSGGARLQRLKQIETLLSDFSRRKQGLWGIFKANVQKFASWITITTGFFGIVKIISKVVKEVKALDDAMVELNKVADLTATQIEKIQKDANVLANKVATTSDRVIRAIAQFKKAGYDLAESTSLAEVALRMTNVADGIENVEDASSSLIAIIKGFGLDASNASEILDLLNHTSNKFAVDVNNLTEGMTKISAVFAQTGTSLEETNALLTATYEILRNADVSATGLNAISQRMRRMTEEGEDNKEVMAKVEETLQKYTRGAVSLYDKRTKELRSTYDVLADLSTVWGSLSSSAKALLTEVIAGNRQNKVLSALMSNWSTVENVLDESKKSIGSAKQEEEKFLDSVTGKLNQLKQSIQEFATSSLTKDFEKGVLSFLTVIVNLGTKMGGLFSVLGSLVAIGIAWKIPNLIITIRSMTTAASTAMTEINGVTHAYKTYTIGNQEYIIATKAYGATADAANIAMAKLKTSLTKAKLAFTAIVIAIEGIILFEKALSSQLAKDAEQAEQNYQSITGQYNTLKTNYNEYLRLLTKTNKTTEEITRLNALEQEFTAKYFGSKSGIFTVGTTLEERTQNAQILANLLVEQTRKQQQAILKRASGVASTYLPKEYYSNWYSSQGQQRLHTFEEMSLKNKVTFLQNVLKNQQFFAGDTSQWAEAYKVYSEMLAEYQALQAVIDLYSSEDMVNLQLQIATFLNATQFSLDSNAETQATLYKGINKLIDKIKSDIAEGDLSDKAREYLETVIADYEEQLSILLQKDFAFEFLNERLTNLKQIQGDKEKELERQEKLKAIEEARLKVLQAERTYALVRTENGWKYVLSESELEEAQSELDSALKDAGLDDLSQAITGIEKLQDIYGLASGTVLDNMREYFRNASNLSNWLAMSWEDKIATLNSFGTVDGKTLSELYEENKQQQLTIPSDIYKFFSSSSLPSHHSGGVVGGKHTTHSNILNTLINATNSPLQNISSKQKDVILNIDELTLPNVSNGSQLAEQLTNYAKQKAQIE